MGAVWSSSILERWTILRVRGESAVRSKDTSLFDLVTPSTPSDTKGLLTAAIRDPDPVVFMEPTRLYRAFREPVPEGEHVVSLGEAAVRRSGDELTVVS